MDAMVRPDWSKARNQLRVIASLSPPSRKPLDAMQTVLIQPTPLPWSRARWI